jgi:hypothetical protein
VQADDAGAERRVAADVSTPLLMLVARRCGLLVGDQAAVVADAHDGGTTMPPNFSQQSAQRMHQQAVQTHHRHHQQAIQTHQRMSRSHTQPMRPTSHWSGGSGQAGPFSVIGFLFKVVLLVAIVGLAIAFGPRLVDEVQQQVDTNTGTGTETPAPEGP